MCAATSKPMLSARRSKPVAAAAGVVLVLAWVAIALLVSPPPSDGADIGGLQQQINAGQGTISSLDNAVSAASGRLAALGSSIASLQRKLSAVQADLDAKHAQLLKLQSELSAAHTRLKQLEAFEVHAEAVLSDQLVNSYESGQPDLVTVVLESSGFQDLLERLAFAQRIQKQDAHVIHDVRIARKAVAAEAVRLGALEVRQQRLTDQVMRERNSVAQTRTSLLSERIAVARDRAAKAGQLSRVRGQVASLQSQLSQAEAAQAASAAQATSSSSGTGSPSAAPAPVSSAGGFVFPLPKSAASPPSTWSPDQGVDISAPGDTPEYAVCSGTIVLHGIGGFGPWAPVLHCDSSIDGYSYVYYGHAGPENQLPVGTHVGAGQVMSSVGPGIVGISTGPHLEIGFADSSGSPIGPQTAGTMLSLLQAAY
jgi:murein DD-endopeptidase MepM/ murein hydrolase activator NlpD